MRDTHLWAEASGPMAPCFPPAITLVSMAFPERYKAQVLEAIETIDLERVGSAIEVLSQARAEGRHIFVCGNGGSASTASHFVADMVKGGYDVDFGIGRGFVNAADTWVMKAIIGLPLE